MELWFILAVLSAVTGGIFIFTTKVAAERNYDIVLLSTIAIILSAFLLLIATAIWSDLRGLDLAVLAIIGANGLFYLGGNLTRHCALRAIDTAVYYPLYKTVTPIIAIGIGYVFFSERFETLAWFGLALSLAVPLLLISHAERWRQRDLSAGLRFMIYSSVLAALAAVTTKIGADRYENTLLFATVADFTTAGFGVALLFLQRKRSNIGERLQANMNSEFIILALWMGFFQALAFVCLVFAFALGPLSIVYTINSLYILIPIILSIIFYNEHWNQRKIIAIVLSIAALALLQ